MAIQTEDADVFLPQFWAGTFWRSTVKRKANLFRRRLSSTYRGFLARQFEADELCESQGIGHRCGTRCFWAVGGLAFSTEGWIRGGRRFEETREGRPTIRRERCAGRAWQREPKGPKLHQDSNGRGRFPPRIDPVPIRPRCRACREVPKHWVFFGRLFDI